MAQPAAWLLLLLASLPIVLGPTEPWCLDNGLRVLSARSARVTDVQRLGVQLQRPAELADLPYSRQDFPIWPPFVRWNGQDSPLSVFPALGNLFFLPFMKAGTPGWILLRAFQLSLLAWAMRTWLRSTFPGDTKWLPVILLTSPVLAYTGLVWEHALITAFLFLLLSERRTPLVRLLSLGYGLLPWLRPESIILSIGAVFLLKGVARKLLLLAGFVIGALIQVWLSGGLIPAQVGNNLQKAFVLVGNLRALLLPSPDPAWWVWAAVLGLFWWVAEWRKAADVWRLPTLLLLLGGWLTLIRQLSGASGFLLPSFGLLIAAPLVLPALSRGFGQGGYLRSREGLLLLVYLVVLLVVSPVREGFHWGPRIWISALSVMSALGLVLLHRAERRWAVFLCLIPGLCAILLLHQRRTTVADHLEHLVAGTQTVIVSNQWSLVGDFPSLARDHRVFCPGNLQSTSLLSRKLAHHGVERISLVTLPGHPMPQVFLHDGWRPEGNVVRLAGNRTALALEVRTLSR